MIPIKLSLEGLFSYQKKQDIDFRRLTEAELFGIFGATGSGKSSILEAISFALYNKVERLDYQGYKYNMMNLKSRRLAIDFTFSTGAQQPEVYRITVQGKRHKTRFDQVGSFDRQVYRQEGGSWVPLDLDHAESIIGLTYDNFKRTIIIPQGKFQEFLQLGAKDRSVMLQEIFGLNKYELSGPLKSLVRQNQQDLSTNAALLGQYTQVDQALMEEKQAEIERLETERTSLGDHLTKLQRQFDAQQHLREAFQQLAQATTHMQQLQAQAPAMEQRRHNLQQYLACLDQFRAKLDKRTELSARLDELAQALHQHRETYQTESRQLDRLQKTYHSIEEAYQMRDQLLQTAEALERVVALKQLSANVQKLQARVTDGQQQVQQLLRELASSEQQQAKLESEVDELQAQLPDTRELLAVEQWFAQKRQLDERAQWIQASIQKTQVKIQQAREEKQLLLRQSPLDRRQYEFSTDKLVALIEQQIARKEAEREELMQAQQQQHVTRHLHQLADQLADGAPCPLCGSEHHPAPYQAQEAQQQLKALEARQQALEQRLKQWQLILPHLRQLARQARELAHELKEARQEQQQLLSEQQRHQLRFTWTQLDATDERAVKQQIEQVQHLQAQITHKNQEIKTQRQHQASLRSKVETYRTRLEELRDTLQHKQGEFQSGQQSLRGVSYEAERKQSDEALTRASRSQREQYVQAEKLYREATQQLKEKQDRLNVLKGTIEAENQQQQAVQQQMAEVSQRLQQTLQASNFSSLEAVSQVLALDINIQEEEEALREFDRSYTEAQTSLADLQRQLEGVSFEQEVYERLRGEIQEKEQQLNALSRDIGGKAEYLRRLKQEWAQKQSLIEARSRLELRQENLKVMEGLFRGSGFVNYVSTVYLENLCAAANQRFMRLTHNALSLEVDAQNNFHVRDLLNGGKARSVKTLSGGQTFQASLCLALALSEQVQQQARAHQNFFFLDEGFGSLDKQSLEVVFQTLKALRQERRIVGIISHVEELQQEIQTYLRIENDAEHGSLVLGSWER